MHERAERASRSTQRATCLVRARGEAGTCMSFVPVTGPARLLRGVPPREGSVEFTDERRTIVMPIRGALPVLGKVRDQDDIHPSVALLAGAARR